MNLANTHPLQSVMNSCKALHNLKHFLSIMVRSA